MKIIKVFLITTLITNSNILISEDWEITAFNEDMFNYVDLESVRFVDDHIYFWRLSDYTTLQESPDPDVPGGYNSLAMYIKADCKIFREATLTIHLFSENMGASSPIAIYNPTEKWQYPRLPGMYGITLDYVCKNLQ